jgi:hypothetical protein
MLMGIGTWLNVSTIYAGIASFVIEMFLYWLLRRSIIAYVLLYS